MNSRPLTTYYNIVSTSVESNIRQAQESRQPAEHMQKYATIINTHKTVWNWKRTYMKHGYTNHIHCNNQNELTDEQLFGSSLPSLPNELYDTSTDFARIMLLILRYAIWPNISHINLILVRVTDVGLIHFTSVSARWRLHRRSVTD